MDSTELVEQVAEDLAGYSANSNSYWLGLPKHTQDEYRAKARAVILEIRGTP